MHERHLHAFVCKHKDCCIITGGCLAHVGNYFFLPWRLITPPLFVCIILSGFSHNPVIRIWWKGQASWRQCATINLQNSSLAAAIKKRILFGIDYGRQGCMHSPKSCQLQLDICVSFYAVHLNMLWYALYPGHVPLVKEISISKRLPGKIEVK